MKKIYFFNILCLLFLLSGKAYASHCAGGEILYKWVSDSTYQIIFKLYRDCGGTQGAPQTVPMCYTSTCDNSSQSIVLTRLAMLPDGKPNGAPVSSGCGGYPTKCEGGVLPGYDEWWYTGVVTMPHRCTEWQFSVSISARNVSNNLTGGSNNDFFIQSTLNNVVAQGNSSPVFTVRPVPFVCLNNPYTYNNGVQDADGDSLHYEIMIPQKGACGTPGVDIPFRDATYNTVNNPFSTGNTFSLNPHNGQMNFTPNATGANTLTLRVREYRHGILIGSATRDIQVQALPCSSIQPEIGTDSISITGGQLINGRVENCANNLMNFCFKIKSPNPGAILVASDNHAAIAPGAVVTYSGQNTDSIRGCFSWTPSPTDTGLRTFAVTVKDSTCLPPGVAVSQTFILPIYIYSVTSILKDTTICAGQSVPLMATGGTAFSWAVLPGGSPISSLSCNNCSTPIATPAVTTRYVVSSNLVSVCNINKDTVTVTVTPYPATPVPFSNSPVCVGDSLRLSSATTADAYLWTGPAGFNSTQQHPVIANAQVPNTGTYQLITTNGRCSSQPATINVIIASTPRMPVITGDTLVCEGAALQLTATSNANTLYRWTGPNGFTANTQILSIPAATPAAAGTYSVIAYHNGTLSCPSPAGSYTVTVSPQIVADFTLSKTTICEQEDITVTTTGPGGSSISYNWDFGISSVLQTGTGSGPFSLHYTQHGTRHITLHVSNAACTDSIRKEVLVLSTPASSFQVQPDACLGENIWLNSTEEVGYNLVYNWDFQGADVLNGSGKGPYNISFRTPGYKIIRLATQNTQCPSVVTTDTIYVHPNPDARITSASQQDVCSGDAVLFTANYNSEYYYEWQPAAYFNRQAATTEGKILRTGQIYLNIKDGYGCTTTDSMLISTKPCCEVFMPDAFTPNGDGKNDLFRMVTAGNQITAEFRVLNRWGQTIFLSGERGNGWDGTYNNKPVDGGTYFYYLKYKCMNGDFFEKKGEVVLIR